jgi:hypothetical protein
MQCDTEPLWVLRLFNEAFPNGALTMSTRGILLELEEHCKTLSSLGSVL